ncbi:ATP-dependent DNA helicase [Corynebacterium heidelbergense]|nr:ATP-dependent DNA helicase [Corynebacterium heidelbergense]
MDADTMAGDDPRSVEDAAQDLLDVAVKDLGGAPRAGQRKMTRAVARAIEREQHLAVQAGTGTGKSLAYLVPAAIHAVSSDTTVVVSTATIALQRQLVERDLPRLAEALDGELPRKLTSAICKGRNNYLCLNKVRGAATDGIPEPEENSLMSAAAISSTGAQVARLHSWADQTEDGDRDNLERGVSDTAWRQVSVTSRECIGANRCPHGEDCFAELARRRAGEADIVVTNHALLAIDALSDVNILPEHDVVIVDEAHELEPRITSTATQELSATAIAILAKRVQKLGLEADGDDLQTAGDGWLDALNQALLQRDITGRWTGIPAGLDGPLRELKDTVWKVNRSMFAMDPSEYVSEPERAAERQSLMVSTEEMHDTIVRILEASPALSGPGGAAASASSAQSPSAAESRGGARSAAGGDVAPSLASSDDPLLGEDVVWLTGEDNRRVIAVAPLSVADLLRQRIFAANTVILTSATLALGGRFSAMLAQWGTSEKHTTTLDVGTPFEPRTHGILYVARDLPKPGREGAPDETVDATAQLINAAGGRTLGLFSSRRAAEAMAEKLRTVVPYPILLQGEDSLSGLVTRFRDDESACLFGTLGLWQGVDVPGPSLSLVVIDRIPFPRPDDPLKQARQEAAAKSGRNGFMEVAANHAALLMAQGAGRLLRSTEDRGVVAVLDSRLATARYGSYIRRSMPDFWETTDRDTVRKALRRLAGGR